MTDRQTELADKLTYARAELLTLHDAIGPIQASVYQLRDQLLATYRELPEFNWDAARAAFYPRLDELNAELRPLTDERKRVEASIKELERELKHAIEEAAKPAKPAKPGKRQGDLFGGN